MLNNVELCGKQFQITFRITVLSPCGGKGVLKEKKNRQGGVNGALV